MAPAHRAGTLCRELLFFLHSYWLLSHHQTSRRWRRKAVKAETIKQQEDQTVRLKTGLAQVLPLPRKGPGVKVPTCLLPAPPFIMNLLLCM
jgi:hypothetical protein